MKIASKSYSGLVIQIIKRYALYAWKGIVHSVWVCQTCHTWWCTRSLIVYSYCLMHRSVTFDFEFVLGIKPSDVTFWPCLTARAKQWTMQPVPHSCWQYLLFSLFLFAVWQESLSHETLTWKNKQTDYLKKFNKNHNNNQQKKCDID